MMMPTLAFQLHICNQEYCAITSKPHGCHCAWLPAGLLQALAPVCSRITAIMNAQHKQQQEQGQEAGRDVDNKQKQHQQRTRSTGGGQQQRGQQQMPQQIPTADRRDLMLLATCLLDLSHALASIWPGPALLAAALAPVT
jgi:hypothetical protein